MIVALDPPDFRTISDFRKRHLKALGELFLQVLKLCETAGLVKLGHVALDGTKIKANASKHKAMSYERMKKRAAELKAEVACMLAAAEAADVQEDEIFGKDKRGDEMPDWASDKAKRLAKIQEAMAALEADAQLAAEEERRIEAEKQQQRNAEGRKKPGKPAAPLPDQPDPKAQRNFTDPDSRIMKSKEGFVQAYNAQAAVDAEAQIIVAHELTQCGSDQGQLVPLVEAIENNLGRKPEQASADSGYCSEANLKALVARGIDGYVAPGRAQHPTAANGKVGGPLTQLMRKKIDDGGFETPYRLRKQVTGTRPVEGWSMGKSIAATLFGILLNRGAYELTQTAPIPEWQTPRDPRAKIRIEDLLHVSSGLRIRAPQDPDYDPSGPYPDHLYLYTGGINSYHYAATRPQQWRPNTVGRYRNTDPVLISYLIRLAVEKSGERSNWWK